MKKLIPLLAMALALALGTAYADDKKEPTAQQNKMAACNKQAGEKKGEERKAFMGECLKAKPAEAAPSPACEKSAADKNLHGAAKAAHVKKCMADSAAAPKK
ncbi:MAG: PsiF family protein [Curvibacter sp.]|jgi:hypothetical protein|nr:phosphate starvation-inducible protein PsiF [Curvibacter sp.]